MGLFSRGIYGQDDFYEKRDRCQVYRDFLESYRLEVDSGVLISWQDYFDRKYRKEEPKAVKIIEGRFMRELEDFVKEHGQKSFSELHGMSL